MLAETEDDMLFIDCETLISIGTWLMFGSSFNLEDSIKSEVCWLSERYAECLFWESELLKLEDEREESMNS
jgi:hypothetical protein